MPSISVVCRVRGTSGKADTDKESIKCVEAVDNSHLSINYVVPGDNQARNSISFSFPTVLDESCSQKSLFDQTVKSLIQKALSGYNTTIFTYGQTGSGKTYSMEGIIGDTERKGIVSRVIETIFAKEDYVKDSIVESIDVKASVIQVYQEKLFDLLSTDKNRKSALRIREGSADATKSTIWVEGACEINLENTQHAEKILSLAYAKRSVGSHNMNECSSRSHLVTSLSVIILYKNRDSGEVEEVQTKIKLVDLAGSEMVRKTDASGQRLEEAKHINRSLSALGKVVATLSSIQQQENNATNNNYCYPNVHVSYRDSKLTRLLQDTLGGNSLTLLLLTISASSAHVMETINTLRFGERASQIVNKAIRNKKVSSEPLEVKRLKLELSEAKATIESLLLEIQVLRNNKLDSPTVFKLKSPLLEQIIRSENEVNYDEVSIKSFQIEKSILISPKYNNSLDEYNDGNVESSVLTSEVFENELNSSEIVDNEMNRCAVCLLSPGECDKLLFNTGECMGELFSCDGNCGNMYHVKCAGVVGSGGQFALPEGEWFCMNCTVEAESTSGSIIPTLEESGLEVMDYTNVIAADAPDEDEEEVMINHDLVHGEGSGTGKVIASLSASYHAMRKERNRILAQWQHEQQINRELELNRVTSYRDKDREYLQLREEYTVLSEKLADERVASKRLSEQNAELWKALQEARKPEKPETFGNPENVSQGKSEPASFTTSLNSQPAVTPLDTKENKRNCADIKMPKLKRVSSITSSSDGSGSFTNEVVTAAAVVTKEINNKDFEIKKPSSGVSGVYLHTDSLSECMKVVESAGKPEIPEENLNSRPPLAKCNTVDNLLRSYGATIINSDNTVISKPRTASLTHSSSESVVGDSQLSRMAQLIESVKQETESVLRLKERLSRRPSPVQHDDQ